MMEASMPPTEPADADRERRLRWAFEQAADHAVIVLDPNGVIAEWNRRAVEITGYSAAEAIGGHFSLLHTVEDRRAGAPAHALAAALRDGRFTSDGWRVRKDGNRFWASAAINPIHDEAGRLAGFTKIVRDESERKAAQDALAESERQFRMLVSGVVDYAIFMLDPNGVISNWNAGAERIKGYTADEIVGRHFSAFYTEEDRAVGTPLRALATAVEQGRYEAEGWRVRKDGSLFWASVIVDAIHDEDGAIVGFAKITRDITDKRNAELELRRAHEQLAQSQKLEALGKLTGGVAHDFNNLLMVVSGQTQLLRRRIGDDPRATKALDAIDTAAQRGADLTRHLLAFSRRQRLLPSPLALPERTDSLRELLTASLPASVRLEMDLPEDLWPITVDASEFELSILNLVVNARDAMPGGGVITIRGENVVLDGQDHPDGLGGEFVALTVEDNGSGIPPDILPKIFDPFFTTKPVDRGTGLGLSQVFGFIRQTGGQVTVQSKLGEGARFTLSLPRADREPAAVADDEPPPQAAASRILLVEDNPEVAIVARQMLEELGHEVVATGGGAEALAALNSGGPFDLVFSDIVMAGELDGLGMAERVREAFPETPILLATGYSEAAERIGDAFPILRKPYRMGDLNRAISALLAPGGGKLVDLERARHARAKRDGR